MSFTAEGERVSEHSAEAERADESDVGPDEGAANSHAADVDAGYDDGGDSPTVGTDSEEDGTL